MTIILIEISYQVFLITSIATTVSKNLGNRLEEVGIRRGIETIYTTVPLGETKILWRVPSPVGWGCRIHQLHLYRGVGPPTTSFLDMTLNHLMVSFQPWRLGECRVLLHCHCSKDHTEPKW